jgi:amicyanin
MKLAGLLIMAAVLVFFMVPAVAADTVQVQIKDYKFQPAQVTVQKGGTVAWSNMDAAAHDVDFKGLKSPLLKKGETYSKIFDTAGTYDYVCGIHPSMKGTVKVV